MSDAATLSSVRSSVVERGIPPVPAIERANDAETAALTQRTSLTNPEFAPAVDPQTVLGEDAGSRLHIRGASRSIPSRRQLGKDKVVSSVGALPPSPDIAAASRLVAPVSSMIERQGELREAVGGSVRELDAGMTISIIQPLDSVGVASDSADLGEVTLTTDSEADLLGVPTSTAKLAASSAMGDETPAGESNQAVTPVSSEARSLAHVLTGTSAGSDSSFRPRAGTLQGALPPTGQSSAANGSGALDEKAEVFFTSAGGLPSVEREADSAYRVAAVSFERGKAEQDRSPAIAGQISATDEAAPEGIVPLMRSSRGEISIRLGDLIGLLEQEMDRPLFVWLKSSSSASKYATFDTLRAAGISVNYDPARNHVVLAVAQADGGPDARSKRMRWPER
jgi:hypothetical protein